MNIPRTLGLVLPTAIIAGVLAFSCGETEEAEEKKPEGPGSSGGPGGASGGGTGNKGGGTTASVSTVSGSTCVASQNTTATSTTNSLGCAILTRDTSGCRATREAAGLSSFWLNFSCNVTLTKSGTSITAATEGTPDYTTYYFGTSHACYAAFPGSRSANPGTIADVSATIDFPASPAEKTGTKTDSELGAVGLAVNGVLIFNDEAGPGDNIYDEASTFDQCEGHPALTHYHYHVEPPAISSNDSSLIGVMRDGFPVYGRKDAGGATPTLDAYGGHLGPLPDDSSKTMYHYHLNLVSGTDGNGSAASAYFIKSGSYYGTPGTTCTNCTPSI